MNSTAFARAGTTGNRLADALDADESRRLFASSRMERLEARRTLHAPGEPLRLVYFPAGCVVGCSAAGAGGAAVETAVVGREGLAGLGAALGERRSQGLTRVLLAGDALCVEAGALRELFAGGPRCAALLTRYYGALVRQVSRRALCNTRHRLSGRLATWLLALAGRAGSDDFRLTQESVARQLGVRRTGVSECVGELERAGAVQHRRNRLRLASREALAAAACACHPAFAEDARWLDGAGFD